MSKLMNSNYDIEFNKFIKENYKYDPNTGFIFNKRTNRMHKERKGECLQIHINYNGKRVNVTQYHLAWFLYYNEWADGYIHHINNNKDNRINNLTIVNDSQSKMKKRKVNKLTSSIYKGVHFHKNILKYIAAIKINGKNSYWYFR